MKISFDGVKRKYAKLIEKIYEKALKETQNDLPNLWVSVIFAKENHVQALNKEFRNVDKSTDVLSFPMLDIVYPQKLVDYKSEYSPNGYLYIGDIVICPKVAKKQAKYFGHSLKREVGFLALHGLLHLLGYDHIEEDDEKIMTKVSEEILQSLNIKRDK